MKIATPQKKVTPFFPSNHSKSWGLVKPSLFENLIGGPNPLQKGRGGGAHYVICYLKIILRTIGQWEFLDSLLWYRCYIQAIIVFHWICLELTQLASLYYFNRIYKMWFLPHLLSHHDLFSFQKFCTCVDDTFLVPVRFICISISRFISLIFISIPVAWNILSLDHCFLILKILCP